MAYKPSRTREERKNAPLYVPEHELRVQLEQQALQKRQQKTLEALQEKQDILDHYENFKLPTGESDAELKNFLAQKRQELDVLNKQLEARDPGLPLPKQAGPRHLGKNEPQPTSSYDIFSKKPENALGQVPIILKEETEREKRIRLREEERVRRLAGIKESAYESSKPYLPQQQLPEIKQTEKKGELESFVPNKRPPSGSLMNVNSKPGFSKGNSLPVLELNQPKDKPDGVPGTLSRRESDRIEAPPQEMLRRASNKEEAQGKIGTPLQRSPQQEGNKANEGITGYEIGQRQGVKRMSTKEQSEKMEQGINFLSRMGSQAGPSEIEKKRRYKEELDMFVKQKEAAAKEEKEVKRTISRGHTRNENYEKLNRIPSSGWRPEENDGYKYASDRGIIESEEKKNQYADELMKEILVREKLKQEENQQSAPKYNAEQRRDIQEVEDRFIRGDNVKRGVGLNDINSFGRDENKIELEKKKKFKESLDAQVEEKKRIQSAKVDNRRDFNENRRDFNQLNQQANGFDKFERKTEEFREEKPRVEDKNAAGNFFLYKTEDDEKQRAQARNLQKQKMADDLKKQMEEKEEQKRREKMRKAEEDLQEKARIDREIEEEKRRQQEELQKKHSKKGENLSPNKDNSKQEKMEGQILSRSRENEHRRQALLEGQSQQNEKDINEEWRVSGPETRDYLPVGQNPYGDQSRNNGNIYSSENNYHSHHGVISGHVGPNAYYGAHNSMPYDPYGGGTQYNYGMQNNLYNDVTTYNQLMHQLMEEKLKIEKIILEEQRVFEEYQNKIKEIHLEKAHYDRESEKIKQILQGKAPLTPSTLGFKSPQKNNQADKLAMLGNSYLPALIDLKNAKASHLSNYNKLLVKSQQQSQIVSNLKGLQSPKLQKAMISNGTRFDHFNLGDTMRSQAVEESALINQPLPSTDQLYQIPSSDFQKSYLRDLEDFQKAAQALNLREDMTLEAYSTAIRDFNLMQCSRAPFDAMNMSSTLPMVSEFRPLDTMQREQESNNLELESNAYRNLERASTEDIATKPVTQNKILVPSNKESFLSSKDEQEFGSNKTSGVKIGSSISQIHRASSDLPFKSLEETSKDQNSLFKRESIQLRKSDNQEREEEYVFGSSPNKVGKGDNQALKLQAPVMGEAKPLVLADEVDDYYEDVFEELMDSGDEAFNKRDNMPNIRYDETPTKRKVVENVERPTTKNSSAKESEKRWGSQQKFNLDEKDASPVRASTQERKFRSPKTLDPFMKARESEERNRDIKSREALESNSRKDNHKFFSEWDQIEKDAKIKFENKREDMRTPSQKIEKEEIIEDYQEIDYDEFEKTLKSKMAENKEEGILQRNKEASLKNEERSKMLFDRLQNLLGDFGDESEIKNNTIREETSEMEYEKGETGKTSPSSSNIFKPLGGSRNYSNRYLREEY